MAAARFIPMNPQKAPSTRAIRMTSTRAQPNPTSDALSSAWASSPATAWFALLLPGCVQWSRGRRARGLAFAWSYGVALALALASWGGSLTFVWLAVAVASQTLGWVDALRESPFLGFTPPAVLAVTGGGLSLAAHLPMIGLLCLFAWPGQGDHPSEGSYLINRLAYRDHAPVAGHWVWLDEAEPGTRRAVRVVAAGGQKVEWTGSRWTVDGRSIDVDSSRVFAGYPRQWGFRVPNHHVLIDSVVPVAPGKPGAPWIMIENDRILGRVWAHALGFWTRRLL